MTYIPACFHWFYNTVQRGSTYVKFHQSRKILSTCFPSNKEKLLNLKHINLITAQEEVKTTKNYIWRTNRPRISLFANFGEQTSPNNWAKFVYEVCEQFCSLQTLEAILGRQLDFRGSIFQLKSDVLKILFWILTPPCSTNFSALRSPALEL